MRYKHIIWDWNGTLLDDRWLCIEAINQTLTKRNMNTITDDEYVKKVKEAGKLRGGQGNKGKTTKK